MITKSRLFIKALIKSIPGFEYIKNPYENSGGATLDARYCYAVWLRHLILAYKSGLTAVPKNIAELGPGDSLGVGISALISGADKYVAFDVIRYQPSKVNLKVFDDLVKLFKNKTDLPDDTEFPNLKPKLVNYDFPSGIFTQPYLDMILAEKRLNKIRGSIESMNEQNQADTSRAISYIVPWNSNFLMKESQVDMILSQAVLQHVDDLDNTYHAMFKWLKPKGLISHQIDFTSVGSSENLQGHWGYSDFEWKILKGRMKYYINRAPYSTYIELSKKYNFKIVHEVKSHFKTIIGKEKLARRFKNLSDEDLSTSGLFIQAIKE